MSTTITVTATGPFHADAAERLTRIAAHLRDSLEVRTPYFRDGEPHVVTCGFSDDPDDEYFGQKLGTFTITDTPR